jgi:hypothetical protein
MCDVCCEDQQMMENLATIPGIEDEDPFDDSALSWTAARSAMLAHAKPNSNYKTDSTVSSIIDGGREPN